MATSKKVTDQFLTCTVCMEVFNDPVTLLCYHTFCRKCVVSFTKTQPKAIGAKSIPCCFCRKWNKVTDSDGSVDEWAAQLKPSYMIQGLTDSFGPGTKDTSNCSYCKEEGETIPATAWCSYCDESLCARCARMHKRNISSREHEVIGLTDEVQVKRRHKVMCKQHTSECLEFLCKDCDKAICQKCCILHHRKCDSVVTIESELPLMKSALTQNRETMKTRQNDTKMAVYERKSKLADVSKMFLQAESEIRAASREARNVILVKETKLLNQLKDITNRQSQQLRAEIKTGEMAIQMYQQQSELIDQAVKSDSEMDIYEMYRSSDSVADTDMELKDTKTVDSINLRNTEELIETLDGIQLGEIDVVYEGGFDLKGLPVLQDAIDVNNLKCLGKPHPHFPPPIINMLSTSCTTQPYPSPSLPQIPSILREIPRIPSLLPPIPSLLPPIPSVLTEPPPPTPKSSPLGPLLPPSPHLFSAGQSKSTAALLEKLRANGLDHHHHHHHHRGEKCRLRFDKLIFDDGNVLSYDLENACPVHLAKTQPRASAHADRREDDSTHAVSVS